MTTQRHIPGGVFLDETGTFEAMVPGGRFVIQTKQTVVTPAPTGTITSQPAPSGQSQRFVGTSTNATSGTYTLTGSSGGVTVGPTSFTVASNAFDFTVVGLEPGTYSPTLTVTGPGGTANVTGTNTFSIMSVDGGGELGEAPDTELPQMFGTPTVSSIYTTGFTLAWQAGADNTGVVRYLVSTNAGVNYTDVGMALTHTFGNLLPNTAYPCRIVAEDAAGNRSQPLSVTVTTAMAADVTAPSAPGNLLFSSITRTSATVSWGAATDDVGVYEYRISMDGGATFINIGTSLTYQLNGLTESTSYPVHVVARDAAGNTSLPSVGTVRTLDPEVTVHDLLAGPPTILGRTSFSGMVRRMTAFVDTPAPKSRTMVLGGRRKSITS